MASWGDVRRIALALPDATEQSSRGHASWRVRDKGFVWERPLRPSEVEALGDRAPTGPILGARGEHLGARKALRDYDGPDPRLPGRAPGCEEGAPRRRSARLLHDAAL